MSSIGSHLSSSLTISSGPHRNCILRFMMAKSPTQIPALCGISIPSLRPTLSNVYMPLGKAPMAYRDYSLQTLSTGSEAAHTGCQYLSDRAGTSRGAVMRVKASASFRSWAWANEVSATVRARASCGGRVFVLAVCAWHIESAHQSTDSQSSRPFQSLLFAKELWSGDDLATEICRTSLRVGAGDDASFSDHQASINRCCATARATPESAPSARAVSGLVGGAIVYSVPCLNFLNLF
ncbi:hypothetical protein BJ912DRAFT_1036656 [Pholiota molesta]|nr:hypothetical protein BJ912DRAFT_1036656 [Pholiota molesta]